MKPHRIIKSFSGSQDGHDHHHFKEGAEIPLSDDLAAIVVKEGWAKEIVDGDDAPESEAKSLDEATANKAIKSAPSNKSKK